MFLFRKDCSPFQAIALYENSMETEARVWKIQREKLLIKTNERANRLQSIR